MENEYNHTVYIDHIVYIDVDGYKRIIKIEKNERRQDKRKIFNLIYFLTKK